MKKPSQELLTELQQLTRSHMAYTEHLLNTPTEILNYKPAADSWSVLECFEHLNRYGQFYIPEIKKRMDTRKSNLPRDEFRSGKLGNYFAMSMLPKPNKKLNKMKTFKSKNPNGSQLNFNVLNEFVNQQSQLLELLEKATQTSLNKIKTSITLPGIKLRLGDTFRFVIYHNERHIQQARRALEFAQANIDAKSHA
jgi:hypothetical protein